MDYYYTVDEDMFLRIARKLFRGRNVSVRHFRACFGVGPATAAELWRMLRARGELPAVTYKPIHLLWTCILFKGNSTLDYMSLVCGVSVPTFRTKAWHVAHRLSLLAKDIVSLGAYRSVLY